MSLYLTAINKKLPYLNAINMIQTSRDKFLDIADSVDAELREKTINLYDKTKRFYTLSQLPVKKREEFFSKKSLNLVFSFCNLSIDVNPSAESFFPYIERVVG